MVDGDNEVGLDVIVAARADTRGVVGGCAVEHVSEEVRRNQGEDGRTITTRFGHLDFGEGGRGGRESDEESGGGDAHVERRRE